MRGRLRVEHPYDEAKRLAMQVRNKQANRTSTAIPVMEPARCRLRVHAYAMCALMLWSPTASGGHVGPSLPRATNAVAARNRLPGGHSQSCASRCSKVAKCRARRGIPPSAPGGLGAPAGALNECQKHRRRCNDKNMIQDASLTRNCNLGICRSNWALKRIFVGGGDARRKGISQDYCMRCSSCGP